jgi:Zn-dependent protease
MGGWWASSWYQAGGVALVAAWIIWIVVSITLHELAHGWAAIGRGDQTPHTSGHMTFNPIVHMGGQSLFMLAMLGIAWGAMPIDPTRMKGRYAEAWVAFAGPLMNFTLAVICILGGGVALALMSDAQNDQFFHGPFQMANTTSSVRAKLAMFAMVGGELNVGLGLFNLIPVPPLDGSRILGNFSRGYHRLMASDAGRVGTTIAFVLAFLLAGRVIWPIGMLVASLGMAIISMVLKLVGVAP